MQKSVLIVDDKDEVRSFLKEVLASNNYSVLEAANGEEALEMVEKTSPNVIILDLMLPKVSGKAVCSKIKNEHPDIVVIVVTGKSNSKDIVRGLQIGADDYITKPFVAEELVARIEARLKTTDQKGGSTKKENIPTEKIKLRESLSLLGLRLIVTEIIFGLLFFLGVTLFSLLNPLLSFIQLSSVYLAAFLFLLITNIILVAYVVLKWYSEFAEVTKEDVMKHNGILYKKEEKFGLSFVEAVAFNQSLLGMMLNYGTIEIYDPSLKEKVYIVNVSDPKKHSKILENVLIKDKNQSVPLMASNK